MSKDCLICNKHKSENPVIYEDDLFYLSHLPLSERPDLGVHLGHLILEPKRHIEQMEDLSGQEQTSFIMLLTSIHRVMKKVTSSPRIYTFSIGEQVPHLHMHLIPRYDGTPSEFIGAKIMDYTGNRTTNIDEILKINLSISQQLSTILAV